MGKQLIKRIGIDLDNTVVDYMAKAAPRMKEMFGIEPTHSEHVSNPELAFLWGGRKNSPKDKWEELGVSDEDRKILYAIRQKLYVEERFFRDVPMLEKDTNELTHRLMDTGYRIYFITARTPNEVIVEDTLFWLRNNGFAFDDVFFTSQKADLCSLMGIRVMLEDDRDHIGECLERGIRVVAKAWPWNAGITHDNFYLASTWREMLAAVRETQ